MLRALRLTNDSDVTPPPAVVPVGPPPPMFGAGLAGGVWLAAPADSTALAASVAIAWRPHALGAAITGAFAPAADVTSVTFDGSVRDIVVGAEARRALEFAPGIHVTPGAGMSLHMVRLDGRFAGGSLASRRYNPAIRLGVTATYGLPRNLDVGLVVSADCLLRRQKYEVASEEILVIPRLQVVTGIFVGVRL
jgi:hypothetical protein